MSKFKKTLGGMNGAPSRRPQSVIPPPPSRDEFRPSRAPRGARTPSLGQALPDVEKLPTDAAPWMKRARRMVIAFERAIAGGHVDEAEMAALERAWAAYEMGGNNDEVIAKVAHVCERAYQAIRRRFKGPAADAYHSCAAVLWAGLPRTVRKYLDHDEVVDVVRHMRGEPTPGSLWFAPLPKYSVGIDERSNTRLSRSVRRSIHATSTSYET